MLSFLPMVQGLSIFDITARAATTAKPTKASTRVPDTNNGPKQKSKVLTELNAQREVKNRQIDKALSDAVRGESFNEHAALKALRHGAKIYLENDGGQSIFALAASKGSTKLVQAFLDASIDPDFAGTKGLAPLNLAIANGHADVVKLLVEAGASTNKMMPEAFGSNFKDAMEFAVTRKIENSAAVVKVLMDQGLELPELNDQGGITVRYNSENLNVPIQPDIKKLFE